MSQNKNKKFLDFALLKRMLKQIKPYNKTFYSTIFLGLALSLISPYKPKIVMMAIEDNILSNVGIGLLYMVGVYIAILVVEAFVQYFYKYLSKVVALNVIEDVRTDVYDHISSLKLGFYNETPIGKLTTRTINDVEALNKTFSEGFTSIVQDILTIVVIIIFMLAENWRLALLTLIPFPLILIATYIFKEKIKSAFKEVRGTVQDLNTFMQERISGMKILQVFSVEDNAFKEFKTINARNRKANTDTVNYFAIYFPTVQILTALALALLVWYAGGRIAIDKAYTDEIVGFYMWSVMLFRPLRMLADRFNTLQMGMVASERVFELLDTDVTLDNNPTVTAERIKGDITFRDVFFAYKEENWILKGVSFDVKQGESLALIGSTGSGKTTTIKLMNRFYDIQKGQILIDGSPIKAYDIHQLREKIAIVQQDVFLFSGSIYDNIVMKNYTITKEQVISAAKEIGVHNFILSLPGGYDFEVKERGATLSSGQRQLISFIRAMVANPDILILDEATAAIDTETELLIQKATERLMQGRTSVIIAHRLSTIQNVNQIVVLEQGRVVEKGNPQELLTQKGEYYKLYTYQFEKSKS